MSDDESYESENEYIADVPMITTDGCQEDSIIYKKSSLQIKKTLKECDLCEKIYTDDMLIKNQNEFTCYHCFYWINYDISMRDIAENTVDLSIAEYIIKCKDDHNTTLCTRNTNHGGCFLCEYKIGIPIKL